MSPAESSNTGTTSTLLPSSYFNLHRTASPGPNLSRALGSESYLYMENTTNGQYHGLPAAGSDALIESYYYNSPIQRPVQRHPVNPISLHSTGPGAFYAGPVRGAGYSIRKGNQYQGDPF